LNSKRKKQLNIDLKKKKFTVCKFIKFNTKLPAMKIYAVSYSTTCEIRTPLEAAATAFLKAVLVFQDVLISQGCILQVSLYLL
jgi:hypothetical protein